LTFPSHIVSTICVGVVVSNLLMKAVTTPGLNTQTVGEG
jgi:hypothetical protein